MATMKSNNAAIAAMQQMLQERIIAEPALAIKLANPKKHLKGRYQLSLPRDTEKSGMSVVDDPDRAINPPGISMTRTTSRMAELLSTANIVYPKPELSDEDKAEPREQAMEQYKQEQLRELRRQSQPKVQPKADRHRSKAGVED